MKLFKKLFTGAKMEPATEPPAPAIEDPIKPGKVDLKKLRFLLSIRGIRRPKLRRYKKRAQPTIFIDGEAKRVPFWRARIHFIHNSMREANEIRRFTRERQLEARSRAAA